MCTHVRWRTGIAAVAFCLAAPCALAQPTVQSTGPTRIKIAAGLVSADDTRAGLLGVWARRRSRPASRIEPHDLPCGRLYINPFRNVALIGFWSATADSLTLTPIDIRQLATGIPAPELKDVFTQIAWGKPTITQITWLTPDRFQEKPGQEPRRRAKAVHDVTTVHRAAVVDLLQGSWIKPGGATVVFEPDGTFREQVSTGPNADEARGTYDFDAVAGGLRRTNAAADAASRAARTITAPLRPIGLTREAGD